MAEINHKKTKWYQQWLSEPRPMPARKVHWVLRGILVFILGYAVYWVISSPFIPNPQLLFHRPASTIGTVYRPADWPTYGHMPSHQRYVEQTISLKGKIRWSLSQSVTADSSPAVVDGKLYVGANFEVVALNASTGENIWIYPMVGPVNSSPAVAEDLLFVGLLDGRVIALNRHSGKLQWQFSADNFINCSPTVVNGILYIGSADGYLYALDAKQGTLIWKIQINGNIVQAPTIRDGIVYTASITDRIYSLSAQTGARRLVFFLSRHIIDTAVVTPGTVYVTTQDGRLTALKHKARQNPWSHSINAIWIQFWLMGVPLPPPPLQPGTLWKTAPQERRSKFVSSPAVAGDRLFVGDDRGRFYALNADNGSTIWTTETDSAVATAPFIAGDTVCFGTKTGTIYGVSTRDGSLRWKFFLGSPLKGDLVYAANLLFARTTDGMLYALE